MYLRIFRTKSETTASTAGVDANYVRHILEEHPTSVVWDKDKKRELRLRVDSEKETHIPKVFGHIADRWQREVLDIAQPSRNESEKRVSSCLVCAPTSTGKTFVAREVMRRFASCFKDGGKIVYLCPTKALAAMVFRDITEWLKDADGDPISGIFTSDIRIRHEDPKTRILVLIPEILEIFLFGAIGDKMRGELQCVIVDEAHEISNPERGPILERFFSFLNCPVYAFSATISGAENFLKWLREFSYRKDTKLIPAEGTPKISRVTDLHYQVFNPLRVDGLISLHPFSLLSTCEEVLTLIDDLPDLLPAQILPTLDALGPLGRKYMYEWISSKKPEAEVSVLDLIGVFSKIIGISFPLKRQDVAEMDRIIRRTLKQIAKSEAGPEVIEGFLNTCRAPVEETFEVIATSHHQPPSSTAIQISALHKVLEEKNMLPAMFFFLTVGGLVSTLTELCSTIELVPELKPDELQQYPRLDDLLAKLRNPKDQTYLKLKSELQDEKFGLFFESLKRGWGPHYRNLCQTARDIVEELFIAGQLRAVFCTTTLATGVHSPCKTVVVCQDQNDFLLPVTWAQIVGRAGRRNMDDFGNIIPLRIKFHRLRDLSCARFTEITGNMGISPAFILRCISTLCLRENISKDEIESFKTMLECPLFLANNYPQQWKAQLTSDYWNMIGLSMLCLNRLGIINENLNPIDLYMIISHIPYMEPQVHAIVYLIMRRLIPVKSRFHAISTILRILAPHAGNGFFRTVMWNTKNPSTKKSTLATKHEWYEEVVEAINSPGKFENLVKQRPVVHLIPFSADTSTHLKTYNKVIEKAGNDFIESFEADPVSTGENLRKELFPFSESCFGFKFGSEVEIKSKKSSIALLAPNLKNDLESPTSLVGLNERVQYFSGCLPFINVEETSNSVYSMLLPDLLYHPYLYHSDISELFDENPEVAERQITKAADDICRKIQTPIEILLMDLQDSEFKSKRGTTKSSNSLEADLQSLNQHLKEAYWAFKKWQSWNNDPRVELLKKGGMLTWKDEKKSPESLDVLPAEKREGEAEGNGDSDDSGDNGDDDGGDGEADDGQPPTTTDDQQEEEEDELPSTLKEEDLIKMRLEKTDKAKIYLPNLIRATYATFSDPVQPFTIEFPGLLLKTTSEMTTFSHAWVLNQKNATECPTVFIIHDNLASEPYHLKNTPPGRNTKCSQCEGKHFLYKIDLKKQAEDFGLLETPSKNLDWSYLRPIVTCPELMKKYCTHRPRNCRDSDPIMDHIPGILDKHTFQNYSPYFGSYLPLIQAYAHRGYNVVMFTLPTSLVSEPEQEKIYETFVRSAISELSSRYSWSEKNRVVLAHGIRQIKSVATLGYPVIQLFNAYHELKSGTFEISEFGCYQLPHYVIRHWKKSKTAECQQLLQLWFDFLVLRTQEIIPEF